jgi:uncharacterized membrane protein SpoIIM required for sporulation
MQFKKKNKISIITLTINLVVMTSFFYSMIYAYKFESITIPSVIKPYINNLAILNEETNDETTINVNNILIDKNDE